MDKKSKVLFVVIFLTILASVGLAYYNYMVRKDYYLKIQTDCDPVAESCFVSVCDPTDDSTCPADETERASYYKFVMKKANLVPNCDQNDENCPAISCEGDNTCTEILCDAETAVEEGADCETNI